MKNPVKYSNIIQHTNLMLKNIKNVFLKHFMFYFFVPTKNSVLSTCFLQYYR